MRIAESEREANLVVDPYVYKQGNAYTLTSFVIVVLQAKERERKKNVSCSSASD